MSDTEKCCGCGFERFTTTQTYDAIALIQQIERAVELGGGGKEFRTTARLRKIPP
jgi:hypothetical protein